MTVGFYSPLPPARTGVADYSAALLAELRKRGAVEIAHPQAMRRRALPLGNNALHAAIYRRALAQPGVTVLHDAVLQHFFLGQLDEAQYIEEFVYNYGEWHRGLARELWRARASSAVGPAVFRISNAAAHRGELARGDRPQPGCRGGGESARAGGERRGDSAPVSRSAGGLERGCAALPAATSGLSPAAFLFGVFGYLRESKRLAQTVEAFPDLRRELPRAALLVAGEFASSDLERAVAPR